MDILRKIQQINVCKFVKLGTPIIFHVIVLQYVQIPHNRMDKSIRSTTLKFVFINVCMDIFLIMIRICVFRNALHLQIFMETLIMIIDVCYFVPKELMLKTIQDYAKAHAREIL
jgi:hypothetical protein